MARPICAVPGCSTPIVAHSLCSKHYRRFRKHGSPHIMLARWGGRTPDQRFWAKVRRGTDEGCWPWTGALNYGGYGHLTRNHHDWMAHRLAYELVKGAIPAGKELDHLCRHHACCNPAHLEPVTRSENSIRGIGPQLTRARQASIKACPRGHPYDLFNTYFAPKTGARSCRYCMNMRSRQSKAAHRLEKSEERYAEALLETR